MSHKALTGAENRKNDYSDEKVVLKMPLTPIQIENILCLEQRVKELIAVGADERTIGAARELLGSAISDYSPALADLSVWWDETTR